MTTTKQYIADAMTAVINSDLDRAIGLLFRASLAYEDDIDKARAFIEPGAARDMALPPMQKLSDKVKTRDVKCPTCKAKPGQPCYRLTSRGPHGKPTNEPLVTSTGKPQYHRLRTERAKEASRHA